MQHIFHAGFFLFIILALLFVLISLLFYFFSERKWRAYYSNELSEIISNELNFLCQRYNLQRNTNKPLALKITSNTQNHKQKRELKSVISRGLRHCSQQPNERFSFDFKHWDTPFRSNDSYFANVSCQLNLMIEFLMSHFHKVFFRSQNVKSANEKLLNDQQFNFIEPILALHHSPSSLVIVIVDGGGNDDDGNPPGFRPNTYRFRNANANINWLWLC